MPRPSVRDALIEHGRRVLHERGYHAAGIAEIATAAGAPKGSFYNHFPSKEAFAVEILKDYVADFWTLLAQTVAAAEGSGFDRLSRLTDALIAMFEGLSKAGCLLGNFAIDASSHSELIRAEVHRSFEAWRSAVRGAIEAGQADGTVTTTLNPEDAAGMFVSAWEGSVMRFRAADNPAPLHEFKRTALTLLRA